MNPTKINAPKIIAGSFLWIIVIGTILLSLPISTVRDGAMPLIDAFFTSTSAVCVTGLSVVDIGTYFTTFGQIVLMFLMQIGGLGIMTLSTFFLILLGKRLQMRDLFVIEGSVGNEIVHGVKGLVKYILLSTLAIEFFGAIILSWRFFSYAKYPILKAVYYGIFHSISAFNNAGLGLCADSITQFKSDWIFVMTVSSLIILGGLGFVVLLNLNTYRFWKKNLLERGRIRLQTKIVLAVSFFLLLSGTLVFLLLEWNNTLSGLTIRDKLVNGFFHATTPRTAGFNSLCMPDMKVATLCFTLFLMFVGGSPGSTAGGIKTSTFMVLLTNTYAIVRGKIDIHLFGRTIPKRVVQEATSVLAISSGLVFLATMTLLIVETKFDFMSIVFEVISAFANVGLSIGITPSLNEISKLAISITMFVGRISPLTMALIVGKRSESPAVGYPTESVMIG
jgi:trk system potassium uptake protein TrkH